MRIWRAAVACTILTAALIVAIVHPRPNAAERGGPTAHGSEAIQFRQVGSPANAGGSRRNGEHGGTLVRLADR
jgi:hypothetical protein